MPRTAVVTGGARGIGKGIAQAFLEEGYKLILVDRNVNQGKDNLMSTLDEFGEKFPGMADGFSCDVSSCGEVQEMSKSAHALFGNGIDVVVSNAGICDVETPFLDITPEQWDRVMKTNLYGGFYVAQAFARKMVGDIRQGRKERGSIIIMGSNQSVVCEPGYTPYCASKHGLLGLTRAVATELAPFGITVNCVCPGYINTPLTKELDSPDFAEAYAKERIPARRVGEVEDVVGLFTFLASDRARWITGQSFIVDGGALACTGRLEDFLQRKGT